MVWVLNSKSNLKYFQGGAQFFLRKRTANREAEFSILASAASSEPGRVNFQDYFHLPSNFSWKCPIHLLGGHVSHPLFRTQQMTSEVMWLIRTSLTSVLTSSFPLLPFFCTHCLHSQAISQGHRRLPLKDWSWGYFVGVCGVFLFSMKWFIVFNPKACLLKRLQLLIPQLNQNIHIHSKGHEQTPALLHLNCQLPQNAVLSFPFQKGSACWSVNNTFAIKSKWT